jgi:hypothetical protein
MRISLGHHTLVSNARAQRPSLWFEPTRRRGAARQLLRVERRFHDSLSASIAEGVSVVGKVQHS